MDKPTNLAFSDEATFRFSRAEILIPLMMIVSIPILALLVDATLDDLPLLGLAVGGMGSIVIGIFGSVNLGHRISERIQISRMFKGEIWECWQFSPSEWESKVEAVCNLMSPVDDGNKPYSGVIASSIFGFILGLIFFAISIFAIKEPIIKISMRYVGVGLFLLMVGAGFFQPMVEKYNANRYRRKALKFAEPRIWFGPNDLYHEALGHTSLKELQKITDQTKSRKRIQFTLEISSGDSYDVVRVPTPVPSGCEERARNLVRRYRAERLHSQSS